MITWYQTQGPMSVGKVGWGLSVMLMVRLLLMGVAVVTSCVHSRSLPEHPGDLFSAGSSVMLRGRRGSWHHCHLLFLY